MRKSIACVAPTILVIGLETSPHAASRVPITRLAEFPGRRDGPSGRKFACRE
jgi:hypothetical protein